MKTKKYLLTFDDSRLHLLCKIEAAMQYQTINEFILDCLRKYLNYGNVNKTSELTADEMDRIMEGIEL